jgi:TonB family protein
MNPVKPEPPAAIACKTTPAWVAGLTQWLIHRAARNAPESLSERLEEEWLADVHARSRAWSRLSFALGCCWATRVIAREHTGSIALASPASGPRLAIPYPHGDFAPFSRRSMTFGLVVALHIAVFYGLMVGLNVNVTKLITIDLENRPPPQTHPRELPPPLPPPTFTHTRIEDPPPEFPPTGDVDPNVIVVPQPPSNSEQLPPAPPPHVVNRVPGGPSSGFPNTDDFYPSAAKRLEEQGLATVRVCVDVNGRLLSDPTTEQSSGSARLDAGALQLAKAGSGHYRASTEDGKPVNSCYPFRVRFQLRN